MSSAQRQKPSIGHINPWTQVGGTEHGTLRIVKAVEEQYHSVAYCLPDSAPVEDLFRKGGVTVARYQKIDHSLRQGLTYLSQSMRLAADFRRRKLSLVHCADIQGAYYAVLAAKLARIPIICHVRNRHDTVPPRDLRVLKFVDHYLFVSKDTWRRFALPVSKEKGRVLYDGLDTPVLPGDRKAVLRELNLPDDAVLIGMFARVSPQKDYPTLIRAAKIVVAEHPAVRFLIVGDHESAEASRTHLAEIRQLIEDAGLTEHFIFTGYRSDVPRLMSSVDLFVLSTHWEGLPLVLIEAMAQGCPIIATEVDGIPEIIEHGRTGLLFPHEDVEALAAHCLKLIADRTLAAELGQAGKGFVSENFSWAKFSHSMLQVYRELIPSG